MLSDEVLEKLIPHVKSMMPKQDWHKIGTLFEKVYLLDYDEDHDAYVFGYWNQYNPLLAFDTKTYTFLGVVMQDFVEEHGVEI